MQNLVILALSLLLVLPSAALAEVVGHLTQVEGRVELLKGGKLPATTAKAQDGVEPGDVLRTKSESRAQITFMDNTTVTLSPESRIAIEEYGFDAAKSKRSAVLQLFQGLAHLVVSQVFKVQEPDFLVKTHTGVMGVRGTDVGIRLSPNDSTFLTFKGLVRVGNIFPEVSGAFKRAEKIAFSFGSGAGVDLKDMQATVVARNLPPTLPFTITEEDRQMFMRQLHDGLKGTARGGKLPSVSDLAANLPDAVSPALTNRINAIMNNLTITPTLISAGPTSGAPSGLETFTFSQSFPSSSSYLASGLSPTASFSGSFLSGSRSVAYPGSNFTTAYNFSATLAAGSWPFSAGVGSFSVISNTVNVSGPAGGILTGTMQVNLAGTGSAQGTFNLSGGVTIDPNGTLTFTPGGTFTATAGSGTIAGGSWVQNPSLSLGASPASSLIRPALTGTGPALTGTGPNPIGSRSHLLGTRQLPGPRL